MIEEAISTYTIDQELGVGMPVFVTIKGFNQLAIVQKIIERKGQKSLGLTANDNASQRRYSSGKILLTDLDRNDFNDAMLVDKEQCIDCLEPFHITTRDQCLAFTAGPEFKLIDLTIGQARTFTNEWMAYLHTLDFSSDGQHMLTVSTGFDTIQEIDLHSKRLCRGGQSKKLGRDRKEYSRPGGEYWERTQRRSRRATGGCRSARH